jgi:hypothetical protein
MPSLFSVKAQVFQGDPGYDTGHVDGPYALSISHMRTMVLVYLPTKLGDF